jgi:hypothetical protein
MNAEQLGWARLLYRSPVDACARRDELEIESTGEMDFLVYAPGAGPSAISRDAWRLPRLSVRVQTNAEALDVQPRGDLLEVRYRVAPGQPLICRLTCEGE